MLGADRKSVDQKGCAGQRKQQIRGWVPELLDKLGFLRSEPSNRARENPNQAIISQPPTTCKTSSGGSTNPAAMKTTESTANEIVAPPASRMSRARKMSMTFTLRWYISERFGSIAPMQRPGMLRHRRTVE